MDAKSVEVTLKLYLKQMRERLEQAASIAKGPKPVPKLGMWKKEWRLRSISSSPFMK
jgi:hypothetical protein